MEEIRAEIERIAELLYQEKKDDAYAGISSLVPELVAYTGGIEDTEKQQKLTEVLGNALGAMEEEDLTLLADILQYDLMDELV